eukprot:TRINITY_DN60904_c0_g1_i1.p1 TRINITY_DN60904_c0_g1~~TRINITY_DN60904_c0_g1_i1.p1  ORF type:complete len:371 (+),score=70.89 TRINITY_DN60904_c0_g1_i1:139-1113(+)
MDNFDEVLQGALGYLGNGRMTKVGKRLGCGCCLILLLLSSLGSVLPLQYGIQVNWVTRQVNTKKVYRGGRHLIGPWNSFIAFPSNAVTVTFSEAESNGLLATRTKDGLSLTLSLSFQYRVVEQELGELYKLANMQYEPLFLRNARDVLLKAAADYEAFEYWQAREKIGKEMQVLLHERLSTVHARCAGLQIMIIELPTEFEDSIVATQVQEQMIKTKQNEQQALRIQADTTVLQAAYSRNVTVTRNSAESTFQQITRIAEATANQRMLDAESSAMQYAQELLHLSTDEMVVYQQFLAYQNLQNASFVYGLGNAMLTLPTVSNVV